jgi:hypothetical protein
MNLRAAQVRIYVDADLLGLGKILAGLRNDVTHPGDPGSVIHKRQRAACPITSPDVLDTHWIPQVAAPGLADHHARQHDHPEPERDRRRPGAQGEDGGPQPAGRVLGSVPLRFPRPFIPNGPRRL